VIGTAMSMATAPTTAAPGDHLRAPEAPR
jgi:hypothetical protein